MVSATARRHGALTGARLELIDRPHQRPVVRERRVDRALQARRSGYSGNFLHSVSTSAFTVARTLVSSGDASTRAMNSAIRSISGFAHAARRHRRRAEPDAARHHRRILIERNRVLVDGDAGGAERRLGDLAGDALREHVDEHDVIVGAAADDAEAGGLHRAREPRRVLHDLFLIRRELRRRGFLEADRLGRDDVHQRSALHAGEHRAIEVLRVALAAEHHAAARAAQRLVRGRRDELGVRHRARMHAAGDEAGDVRHVDHQRRADALGHRAHAREVDHARIRAGADDDHLRLVLVGELLELVVIDPLVVLAHAVRDDRVELP